MKTPALASVPEKARRTTKLPASVVQVPREDLKKFLQCKRVGNYFLGKTLGEGSFAKVKEGFHSPTGEKVNHSIHFLHESKIDRLEIVFTLSNYELTCSISLVNILRTQSICQSVTLLGGQSGRHFQV